MNATETVVYKEAGLHWLELAPIGWQAQVDKLTSSQKQELSNWLDSVIERSARLRAYVDARGAVGCGDGGHNDGVKEGNKLVRKIRKALGFTYPNGHDLSF
jgi:hypothetical protein